MAESKPGKARPAYKGHAKTAGLVGEVHTAVKAVIYDPPPAKKAAGKAKSTKGGKTASKQKTPPVPPPAGPAPSFTSAEGTYLASPVSTSGFDFGTPFGQFSTYNGASGQYGGPPGEFGQTGTMSSLSLSSHTPRTPAANGEAGPRSTVKAKKSTASVKTIKR